MEKLKKFNDRLKSRKSAPKSKRLSVRDRIKSIEGSKSSKTSRRARSSSRSRSKSRSSSKIKNEESSCSEVVSKEEIEEVQKIPPTLSELREVFSHENLKKTSVSDFVPMYKGPRYSQALTEIVRGNNSYADNVIASMFEDNGINVIMNIDDIIEGLPILSRFDNVITNPVVNLCTCKRLNMIKRYFPSVRTKIRDNVKTRDIAIDIHFYDFEILNLKGTSTLMSKWKFDQDQLSTLSYSFTGHNFSFLGDESSIIVAKTNGNIDVDLKNKALTISTIIDLEHNEFSEYIAQLI
jgi:hypothetical protein